MKSTVSFHILMHSVSYLCSTSFKRFEHGEKCLVDSDRAIVVPRRNRESSWFAACCVFFLLQFVFLVCVADVCVVLFLASPGMSTSSQGSSD